ncbi:poly rna polymerase gld-2-like protein a [Stylonychia lemnae]|uniref:Poly rna polymerase gld-2-like protein a n=1 Tax=Stylonychia lemnae TaxID=5949 RepID=A0A078A4P1_STYLE|nr:poly rna polymerase gld-2-like protein a [Stylonychia lemnae]|eukprot:CDW77137.1 poly rna polymerase gld-2-like protein a [Stylonychia lemnae]
MQHNLIKPQIKQQNSMPSDTQLVTQSPVLHNQQQNIQRSHSSNDVQTNQLQSKLDEIIPYLYFNQSVAQKLEEVYIKIAEVINQELSEKYKNSYEIVLYGSAVTGLSLPYDSDLDIAILFEDLEINHIIILNQIRMKLIQPYYLKRYDQIKILEMKSGVMLSLFDKINKMRIEIQVNKYCELMNSQLIQTYAKIDSRFFQLVLLLKKWNRNKFSNKVMRLNSYSFVLMAIARMQFLGQLPYLQKHREQDKVIMNYQKCLVKDQKCIFNKIYSTNIAFESDLNVIAQNFQPSKNLSTGKHYTLAELLVDFYSYLIDLLGQINTQVVQITYDTNEINNNFNRNLDLKQIKQIIEDKYNQQQQNNDSYVQNNVLKNLESYSLMILDPFDRTYNPAKSLFKRRDQEIKYLKELKQTLQNLQQQNIFDFK